MKWLKGLLGIGGWLPWPLGQKIYDKGYADGYKEGQDWGHEHDACEHTHPFDGALAMLGANRDSKRAPGFGTYHNGG